MCFMQFPGNVGILWKEYSVFDAVLREGGNSVLGIQCVWCSARGRWELWKEYSVFDAVPREGGNFVEGIQCLMQCPRKVGILWKEYSVWCSAQGRWEFYRRNTVCLMQCPGKVGILWKEYSVFDAMPREGGNSVEGIQCVWCSAQGRWEFCGRNTVCLMQCPGKVGILW